MDIGVPELLIILVIVVLIFGAGRVSQVAGEFGKAIHEFRKGLRDDDSPPAPKAEENRGLEEKNIAG
jgi:sec-independent protein translocase protein TatA